MTVLDPARSVRDTVIEHADESERLGHLAPATVAALRDAQLFRLLTPKQYGGVEADVHSFADTVADVAAADGAAGWCVMIAATTALTAHHLEPAWAELIHGSFTACSGGAVAPSGRVARGLADGPGDALRVRGRWAWGSGTDHCDWICGGVLDEAGHQQLAWFRADQVSIIPTWNPVGLKATASNDYEVDTIIEPGALTNVARYGHLDTELARTPLMSVLAVGVGAALLGMARTALDEVIEMAPTRRAAQSSRPLSTSSRAAHVVAYSSTSVRAAGALLHDRIESMTDTVHCGDPVTVEQRGDIRLAVAHAATTARQVTSALQDLAGGDGVRPGRLSRAFRDAHTASAHVMAADRTYETVGRHLLGNEVDTAWW
jgi:indole-3-acetate monooxygenase